MRLTSWLKNLKYPVPCRRQQRWSNDVSAVVERLESRRVLSTGVAAVGFETRVNSFIPNNQVLSAVAMAPAGDYVVTWQSQGQDGSLNGIYAQRYSAAGTALGSEFKVNTHTANDQEFPSVAIDASGDFVIAWTSNLQDGDSFGIFAQRFNAAGVVQGNEFQVNTFTTGIQKGPSVAMDATGNFVVAWGSYGPDGSGSGICARRYNAAGVAQGTEFNVNTYTTNRQDFPNVAMDLTGDFVVTWDSLGQDGNGFGIFARRYNSTGVAQGNDFQVNVYTTSDQGLPVIAVDATGDFVIAWSSLGQDGKSEGVFARRFNATGTALGGDFQVNTYTTEAQSRQSIAMDASGEFTIAWQSYGQEGGVPTTSQYGVYAQRYNAAGVRQGSEFQVNTYTTGGQRSPTAAMDALGDFVITWSSSSQDGSAAGVYSQRYVPTVGPLVTAVLENAGPKVVNTGDILTASITGLTVIFSDELVSDVGGTHSVINPSNWELTRWGVDVSDLITGITRFIDPTTNKSSYEVLFSQPLTQGGYQLIARQSIEDLSGRMLDGEADRVPGGDFRRNFSVAKTLPATNTEFQVNAYTTNAQESSSTAMDAAGDYVIAWIGTGPGPGGNGVVGVFARRYNSAGIPLGNEFLASSDTLTFGRPSVAMDAAGDFVVAWNAYQNGDPTLVSLHSGSAATGLPIGGDFKVSTFAPTRITAPDIAMDPKGDFVISWEGRGQGTSDEDVFARCYNASGVAQGADFLVNSYTTGEQGGQSVAMDSVGDFVVTWTDYQNFSDIENVFAQRYASGGFPLGNEFLVNTYTTGTQINPRIGMDAAGDFAIAWNDVFGNDGEGRGIFARRFDDTGAPLGNDFQVNNDASADHNSPAIAMNATGEFVIAYADTADGSNNFGIGARRFDSAGVAQGNSFQLNRFTPGDQGSPAAAIDTSGDFVVAWESDGQDGSDFGVYALRFKADVAPVLSQVEAAPLQAVGPLVTPVTSSLAVFDIDSDTWTGATVRISSNYRSDQDQLGFVNTARITGAWDPTTGTLTLSGTDTVSNYRSALRNVTYHNTSSAPNTALARTVDFQVNDGLLFSNIVSRDVAVLATSRSAGLVGSQRDGNVFRERDAASDCRQPGRIRFGQSGPRQCDGLVCELAGGRSRQFQQYLCFTAHILSESGRAYGRSDDHGFGYAGTLSNSPSIRHLFGCQ